MKRDLPAYVYRKGKRGYLYFTRGGKTTRMHKTPGTAEFAVEYARLLRGDHGTEATKTYKRLIASYIASPRFKKLSDATKRDYRKHMAWIEERAGAVDPAKMRRVDMIQMRDALADTPTLANRRVAFMSTLMEHAIDIGWIEHNPCHGVQSLEPTGRVRLPWPQDMIDAFRETADFDTRLLFELLLGTGQRIGDVLRMQWSHVEGDGINVKQGKTKAALWIPLTGTLRAMLAETPRRSLYIVSQANGRPMSYPLAWKRIMGVRKQIGAEAYDIHGLRHSAASELAALGLDDAHIQAITGHTSSGVLRTYAGAAMQKKRATEAQKRREQKDDEA